MCQNNVGFITGESSHESDVDRARPAILASDTATDTTIPETVRCDVRVDSNN